MARYSWTERREITVAVTLAIIGMAVATVHFFVANLDMKWDNTYVEWQSIRTPGYPAFLSLVGLATPSFEALRPLQAAILVLGTSFIGAAMARLMEQRWIPIAFGCAVYATYMLWKWTAQMYPEALFVPLTLAFLGASALALVTRWPAWVLVAGTALGCAILVRPVGYAFVPALVFLGLALWRHQGFRTPLYLAAPCFGILLATSVANGLARGYYATQEFGGINLLGQVAPLIPPEGFGDGLSAQMGAAVAPYHAATKRAEGDVLFWVTRQGYNPAIWGILVPISKAVDSEEGLSVNQEAWRVGLRAIRFDPPGYAAIFTAHWYGMRTWRWISTAERSAESARVVTSGELAEFLGRYAKLSNLKLLPPALYHLKLLLAAVVFLICTWLPVHALLRRLDDPVLNFAATSALCVHGYNFLIAAVEVAENRYAIAILPVAYLAIATTAHIASRSWQAFRGPRPRRMRGLLPR